MAKLSLSDLQKLREAQKAVFRKKDGITHYLLVCFETACISSKAGVLYKELEDEVKKQGLENKVQIVPTGCLGYCEKGPLVKVREPGKPEELFYVEVNKSGDAAEILSEHVCKGAEVTRLINKGKDGSLQRSEKEMDFYKKQCQVVMKKRGGTNPMDINEYIARKSHCNETRRHCCRTQSFRAPRSWRRRLSYMDEVGLHT